MCKIDSKWEFGVWNRAQPSVPWQPRGAWWGTRWEGASRRKGTCEYLWLICVIKECSKYCTTALISHTSKVMLKILQARLQQYMNHQLPDVQAGFRKGRGIRDQIANICWIIKKARGFLKNIYFCFIDYAKAFDCVDHNKLWKILKEMGIPNYLTSLLRNLYASQKVTVRTGHGTTVWLQIRKGVCEGCILSPCLFNLYA